MRILNVCYEQPIQHAIEVVCIITPLGRAIEHFIGYTVFIKHSSIILFNSPLSPPVCLSTQRKKKGKKTT